MLQPYVSVPSFATTVDAKVRLKTPGLNHRVKKKLLMIIMAKIIDGYASKCLLHCLKQTETKYGEAVVHSDGLRSRVYS